MSIDHWVPVVSSLYPGMIKNFQWDVAPLPKNPRTGLRITSSSNWATAIFAKTKYPEEAYKIWHWMNSDEGMYARSLGMAGPMMPSGPADKWPMLTKALQEMKTPANAKVFLDALAYSRSDIVPRANAQEIFGAMNPLLEELWLGRKTAAEVAPLIKAAVDPLMKK
ncbi:MAG: hypothetical protein IT330_00970 [Anaerolineae bacterium]|nr:hypothetical protein [Anaerolineae bacterium]